VQVVIIDNCSPVPVEETLRDLLAQYPHVNVELIRNAVNIGANANITRCLEICDTPWLWMIGDDDTAHPHAIATILRHIDQHPDAVYLNFAWDGCRPQTYTTRGLDQFVDKLDRSANLPWISNAVRRAEVMREQVKFGYQYCYSLMPHVAILLVALEQGGVACMSSDTVVVIERDETPIEHQWSGVNLALGYPVLFDLPMKPRTRGNCRANCC
jgi:glycosyltransferase involved in cell wall biosynthesis